MSTSAAQSSIPRDAAVVEDLKKKLSRDKRRSRVVSEKFSKCKGSSKIHPMNQPYVMVHLPAVSEQSKKDFSFPKVELHLHLDGSIRFSTLLELSLFCGTPLKGAKTVEELKKVLTTHEPANLSKVLEAFDLLLPVVRGDEAAIERIAYEMCEDQAANGVIYFEARYSPHLLCVPGGKLSSVGVVEAVKRGFDRGEAKFGVKARSIVCCIRGLHQYADDVLQIATNCRHLGVVAIDVAGSAHGADEQYEQQIVDIFEQAFKRGIHRTVHAGESGATNEVLKAINDMHAERIGHGYHIMEDPEFYKKSFIDDKRIHLEACPYSSVMTGSVPLDWKNHPVATWAKDNVNFSISRDDPTCFDNTMFSELQLAKDEIGVTVHQLWQCQVNAARSCFLPEEEKKPIIEKILAAEPPSH
ncbi:hypothetical protein KIN20_015721 [Parelaphostrongylus tenuis]|uniref:adenosine deaminase n=1 Tax=Parelaphostrongylus tenuis TaxID=148309 RepID=A0AAD5QQ93_PARTN|nr:hypothetical protein KIN20_015721 [Parelaphostrongylus tenuis]